MTILLIILHLAVSVTLIAVVLLQSGKGAEMGATFGTGGSQSVFGAGGGTTFMSKVTTGCAIVFMFTSLTLAYLGGHSETSSVMARKAKQAATPQKAAPAPGAPAGTAQPAAAPTSTPAAQPPATPAGQPAKPVQPAPAAPAK